MIVRHFLQWVRTATAGERADATSALARALLFSDLSHDDRVAAEGALVMLLDDPSPLVRGAAVWALAQLDPTRFAALAARHRAAETDAGVREEWAAALTSPDESSRADLTRASITRHPPDQVRQ